MFVIMERYVFKNNLPQGILVQTGKFSRSNAVHYFMGLVSHFNNNGYPTKHYLRNERNKPLRGTIRVEVDNFYYYIELLPL